MILHGINSNVKDEPTPPLSRLQHISNSDTWLSRIDFAFCEILVLGGTT